MSDPRKVAENRDIRAWAAAQGMDIDDRGRIPADVRSAWETERLSTPRVDDGAAAEDGYLEGELARYEGLKVAGADPPWDQVVTGGERVPAEPVTSRRKWGRKSRGERAETIVVGRDRRRMSLEKLTGAGWALLAHAAAVNGQLPVSRCLQLQAPVAGILIDEALKGTLADRVLQPFARTSARAETAFALLGPPVLVAAITRQPGLYPQLEPFLISAMESWLDIAGPKLKAQQARQKKRAEAFGADDIRDLLQQIFPELTAVADVPAA